MISLDTPQAQRETILGNRRDDHPATTGGITHEPDSLRSWIRGTLCNVDRSSGGGHRG